MSISGKQRWVLLIFLLGLTLSATAWVSQQEVAAETVQVPRPALTRPVVVEKTQENPGALKIDKLQRAPAEEAETDLFAAKSWYVPPPPPKPVPPPPPSAPPLPFVYLGKLIEDGQQTVFLSKQERNYVVKMGDTIEGTYRVEEISSRVMTLVYLPLNIKQTLMIGSE